VWLSFGLRGPGAVTEVQRLCAAGATLTGYNEYPGHRAALMRDPEGNEFDLH